MTSRSINSELERAKTQEAREGQIFTSPETLALVIEANKTIAKNDPTRLILADGMHLVSIVPESYTGRWSKR